MLLNPDGHPLLSLMPAISYRSLLTSHSALTQSVAPFCSAWSETVEVGLRRWHPKGTFSAVRTLSSSTLPNRD